MLRKTRDKRDSGLLVLSPARILEHPGLWHLLLKYKNFLPYSPRTLKLLFSTPLSLSFYAEGVSLPFLLLLHSRVGDSSPMLHYRTSCAAVVSSLG